MAIIIETEWDRLVNETEALVFDISTDCWYFFKSKDQLIGRFTTKNQPVAYPCENLDLFNKVSLTPCTLLNKMIKVENLLNGIH